MRTLKDYAKYLRENCLREYSKNYIDIIRSMDIPIVKLALEKGMVKSLEDEETIQRTIKSQEDYFLSIEQGTIFEKAAISLRNWEQDKVPGIKRNEVQPSDLILIYAAQKKAIYKFLPRFTKNTEEAAAIITELESCYMTLQDEAVKLLFKIQQETQQQLNQSESELKRLNNFLDSVLENIPNMVFVKNAHDLKFVRFNKAGEKLLGYSKEDLLGKNDYDFFPKEQADFFTANDHAVLGQNDIIDIPEEPINTKQGPRWLHTRKIPIKGPDGKAVYLLGISEDITEIRSARLELEKKTKELERSNTELEQFAYVASHDLQEPLRTVSSYVQLLASRYKGRLDSEADEFIDFAVDGSKRMRQLIQSLLEYSRVNRVKPFEWINLNDVLDEIKQDMKDQIKETGAIIKHNGMPKIYGDVVLIGQLFQNLIGNAIKFKGDQIPEIEIGGKRKNGEYIFSVKDNGIGIQKEYNEKIFVIFQRLNNREKYPGTGIGLSICKKIVERHGGKIWVESEPNKGSCFYFTIKAA
jgi:PAS domain S-box-containing protein